MDPVTLIVTALVAGASAGVSGTASTAVSDAYAWLKSLLARRFLGRQPAVDALNGVDAEPEVWAPRLATELTETGAADQTVVEAARRLLEAADPAGTLAGKYTVDLREAKGVQVGDDNTQHNTFG